MIIKGVHLNATLCVYTTLLYETMNHVMSLTTVVTSTNDDLQIIVILTIISVTNSLHKNSP